MTPAPFGNALRIAVRDGSPNDSFTWTRNGSGPYFHRQLITEQMGSLLTRLAQYMRGCCKSLDTTSAAFADYRTILARLRDEFEVGIYNLNYDDVTHRVWPDAFSGFHDKRFDARAVGRRPEWDFVYHLHGSVHYSFPTSSVRNEVIWRDDLDGPFVVCQHLAAEMAPEFRPVLPATLVAGGYKLDQLLADPAQSFHASLVRHVHEADAVLIAGYGFGDVHVNRALRNRFDLPDPGRIQRPPVVVVDKTTPTPHATVNLRQSHEFWAWELTHALSCRFWSDAARPETWMSVEQLIEGLAFETDIANRTAVWHGGFIESLGCIDRIVAWLHR
jgi:hypothetical protein